MLILAEMQRIPANMRNLIANRHHVGNRPNGALNESQPLMEAVLVTFFKKQLHTKADPHNGFALLRLLNHQFSHAAVPQFASGIPESAYPRQNQPIGLADHIGIIGNNGIRSDGSKGTLQRPGNLD